MAQSAPARSGRVRPAILALYALGVVVTFWLSTVRGSDDPLYDYDARFWFLGGTMWLRGESPYAHGPFLEVWQRQYGELPMVSAGFVYPGTILPISLTLGAFPWDTARWVMRALSLLAYGGTLVALRGLVVRNAPAEERDRRDLWVAIAAFAPGAWLAIFQGQVALIVTLGVVLLWTGLVRGRTSLVVAGMVLALVKPQMSLVPVLFLAARHRDRRLVWGAAATAALCAAVCLWSSPAQVLADLRGGLDAHLEQEFNHYERYDSLFSCLGATPLGSAATWAGLLAGCAAGIGLGAAARRAGTERAELRLFQMALVVTAAAMPVHRYDLAIYMMLLATAWALGSARRGAVLLALVVAHGFTFPVAWHLQHALGLSVPYRTIASRIAPALAAAELIALVGWWIRDRACADRAEAPGG